jgi:hypothetical protein
MQKLKMKFKFLSSVNNTVDSEINKINESGSRIQLNFDSNLETQTIDVQMMFRIFYWAAFLGKEEVVERIVRLGFSPYVKSYEKKNALMAAIEGKQIAVTKLILSFTYVPHHFETYESTKLSTDFFGNTVLHLAYKNKIHD